VIEQALQLGVPRSCQAASSARRRRRLGYEQRLWLFSILAALPATAVALILLWTGDFALRTQWTLTLLIVVSGWLFTVALHHRVVYPLRTVSNMLAALREEDFSLRARGARTDDALGDLLVEINALGEALRDQRLGAVEATALLRKVMAEIDVAVFTFDERQKLQFANPCGERLLGARAGRLRGCGATDLGLAECLAGDTPRIIPIDLPGGAGRWEIRRSTFRMEGRPRQLLVLSDLTKSLREEERQAWKRLIQVLRHEINNSLAPIDSLAGSVVSLLNRRPRPSDWEADMNDGLTVIRERSKALNRFMTAYSGLTRLPRPRLGPVAVGDRVRRVAGLEVRQHIHIVAGPERTIRADGDQLDQLLINLMRNAVDAAQETGGQVRVGWREAGNGFPWIEVWVEDEGPGLSNTENLFVPFFTTKPDGAGIGLALCREIAEAHGGGLSLVNRSDRSGCRACLRLPANGTHA
jgi:two-component system nitrogen regulation sensor histidine kinase NtrY